VLEILSLPPGEECSCRYQPGNNAPHLTGEDTGRGCPLCADTSFYPDDLMDAAIRTLNDAYAKMPATEDPDEWEVEKIKLLYCASAYRWYYQNDQLTTVVREHKFRTPVPNPNAKNNCNLRNLLLDGIIDKIVERNGKHYVMEHKSTGSGLDDVNTTTKFWKHLNLDTQTLLYPYMCRLVLPELDVTGVLYDAFHKPTIKPKKLTQGESKKFVADGEYCGQTFDVKDTGLAAPYITVNGKIAAVEPGAKKGTFAIRETPEMYGARLMQDICERPQFYFARREIPRTDEQIARFGVELANIYQMIKLAHSADCWIHCERQCEATYPCTYIDLCYNGVDPDGELPAGLVRTFKKEGITV
jgi:hypothetical protein